ncbi:uncharacterized protein [Amphiura filiformis]|uniref:uncharacterized protein n=1 Tax=Amphiura filiformis TaxID=82378 RepID=UPI003B20EC2B
MVSQLLFRLSLSHLLALLLMLVYAVDAAGEIFREQPADVSVILGNRVQLNCRVNQDVLQQVSPKVAIWYQIKNNQAEEIKSGQEDRFFIGSTHGVFDLVMDYTTLSDSDTSYFCSFNLTASRTATLNLLPESWKPSCVSYPAVSMVRDGDEVQMICTSDGDGRTELLWQKNGVILTGAEKSVTGNAVSLTYSESITDSESPTFTCIAMISGMSQSELCTIGPIEIVGNSSKTGAYIPYVIVGLLSVVVSMLFLTLIVVVFRHRRCRMCHREPPPPQTVLDMAALQNGAPLFYPIHHDSDDGTDDGIGRSPPPDVIPTAPAPVNTANKRIPKSKSVVDRSGNSRRPRQQEKRREGQGVTRSKTTRERAPRQLEVPGAPLRRTSSNTTLQGNIDDRTKDKTVTGKKKLTMTNFVKSPSSKTTGKTTGKTSSQKQQPRNSKQQPRSNRQSNYQVQSNGAKKRGRQTDEDAKSLKQLNIDTSAASSSQQDTSGQSGHADISIDANDISLDIVGTSSDEPASASLNDLDNNLSSRDSDVRRSGGQSLYKKNVTSRPVSQDMNSWEELHQLQLPPSENPDLNAATSSGASQVMSVPSTTSGATKSDKVIYAELDFKKPVGLNILPDV